jgi:RNA polymerase sigma-70 factor, ECF subfamily
MHGANPTSSEASTALDRAYGRYFPLIREKCRRMLGDAHEAQDVAQETFIRLWSSGPALETPAAVAAWVYRTSTRIAIDRMRSRRAHDVAVSVRADDSERSTESPEAALRFRQLWGALAATVPERELEIALLDRLDGLTQREVADVTGVSERTVRRLLASFDARLTQFTEERLP